jgi:WD40 repeat protein
LKGHSDEVYHIEFSPDGSRLVTVSPDGLAIIWDAHTGEKLLTLSEGSSLYWVVFSPDGSRIAVANFDGGWVSIWDVMTGERLRTLVHPNTKVASVSYSPDGRRIATTSRDHIVRIWDADSGRELLTLYASTNSATNTAYSPDATRVASVVRNSQVRIWDADTGQELLTIGGHSLDVLNVAFSPDGNHIVTASRDGTARVWNVSPSRELLTLVNRPANASLAAALAYSPNGTRLAAAYSDPIAKVWDLTTGKLLLSLTGHTKAVTFIAYSSDGTRVATASEDGTARIWDAQTGKELFTLSGHHEPVVSVAFSPDGSRIATASDDWTAKVWDAKTGKIIFNLDYADVVTSVVFSPDGKIIATAGADRTTKLWDALTGKKLFSLTGHKDYIGQVVFSPDGTRLATASRDGSAKVWDAVSGEELFTLLGHDGTVFSVAFSPDGKTIATAGADRTTKLWDALTGKELLTLHAPDGLTDVAFSPDGLQLAVASRDGTDRIYLLKIEDLITLAKQRVTRSLTSEECQQYLHVEACDVGIKGEQSISLPSVRRSLFILRGTAMNRKISRRDALKVGTVGILGGLAACSPMAQATQSLLPTASPFPTRIPASPDTSAAGEESTASSTVTALIQDIAAYATRYLDSLDQAQRSKSTYAFNDPELTRWHWTTPRNVPRNGLPLNEMQAAQRDAAFALLQTSLSAYGLQKSLDIISLQNDLGNDPELYYVTVFGTPGVEPWGWRWEGHHLSRRFNIINGKLSVTPFFLGAWPTVNNAGLKAMEREEWAARDLLTSMDEAQRATAIFQKKTLGNHVTQNAVYVTPLETVGIAASSLNADQQALVMEVIHKYLDTLPDLVAASHLNRLQAAGFESITFGWAGSLEERHPYYYRLQGPTFLMEHDNSRNGGTHIHSVWRDFAEDFGQSF